MESLAKLLALTNLVGRAGSNFLISNVLCCVAVCNSYREKAVLQGLFRKLGWSGRAAPPSVRVVVSLAVPWRLPASQTHLEGCISLFWWEGGASAKLTALPCKSGPSPLQHSVICVSVRAHRAGSTFWLPRPFCILPISLFPFPQRPVGVAGPFPRCQQCNPFWFKCSLV